LDAHILIILLSYVAIPQGLAEEQRQILLETVTSEAERNVGIPAIFACCEAVREWLVDNNFKGQDDGSMYAQMLRKAKEAEKEKVSESSFVIIVHVAQLCACSLVSSRFVNAQYPIPDVLFGECEWFALRGQIWCSCSERCVAMACSLKS
jgi:hypothetical protein